MLFLQIATDMRFIWLVCVVLKSTQANGCLDGVFKLKYA